MTRHCEYNASFELARVHQEMMREARAQERMARQAQQDEPAAERAARPALPRRLGQMVWTLVRQSVRTTTLFLTNP